MGRIGGGEDGHSKLMTGCTAGVGKGVLVSMAMKSCLKVKNRERWDPPY